MENVANFSVETKDVETLRAYVWLCETNQPYKKPEPSLETPYFLGKYGGTGYYFIYEPGKESVLNLDTLFLIKSKCKRYVIHAHHCVLSPEYLKQCRIVFKQIPFQISRVNKAEHRKYSFSNLRANIFVSATAKKENKNGN